MKESSVGEDHRNVSCSRGIYRSRLSPHSLTPGEKLNVREGITTSADQPSDDLATLASQIASHGMNRNPGGIRILTIKTKIDTVLRDHDSNFGFKRSRLSWFGRLLDQLQHGRVAPHGFV